jgi:hypothetical protein
VDIFLYNATNGQLNKAEVVPSSLTVWFPALSRSPASTCYSWTNPRIMLCDPAGISHCQQGPLLSTGIDFMLQCTKWFYLCLPVRIMCLGQAMAETSSIGDVWRHHGPHSYCHDSRTDCCPYLPQLALSNQVVLCREPAPSMHGQAVIEAAFTNKPWLNGQVYRCGVSFLEPLTP